MLTEKEVRDIFRQHIKDDSVFAECWPDTDRNFYEWCSQYLDYKHIESNEDG